MDVQNGVRLSGDAQPVRAMAVRSARLSTYTMFLADGLGFGIWAGHIPALKQRFQLSDSSLSIVLVSHGGNGLGCS